MSAYPPPFENVPIFDASYFEPALDTAGTGFTINQLKSKFLTFPTAQSATETIPNLVVSSSGYAPTRTAGDNSTAIATTAFVQGNFASLTANNFFTNAINRVTDISTAAYSQITPSGLDIFANGSPNVFTSAIGADFWDIENGNNLVEVTPTSISITDGTSTSTISATAITGALGAGTTAVTQTAGNISTLVATTAFVSTAAFPAVTNPLPIYFNVGVGGSSYGNSNLKTMTFDLMFATGFIAVNVFFNFTALQVSLLQIYKGVTFYLSQSTAGATYKVALYNSSGTMLIATNTFTSTGVIGFHSLDFTSQYTPVNEIVYVALYRGGTSGTTQLYFNSLSEIILNCSTVTPTYNALIGRAFRQTSIPATFPTQISSTPSLASNQYAFWYGLY
jgi:hypothetical protein